LTTQGTKGKRGRPPLGAFEVTLAKASILRSAAVVYNRTGKDGPVQAILEEANVSRATFYKHFPSKEALQEALLDVALNAMLGEVEDAIGRADALVDRIDAGIRTFLSFHVQQPGVYRVLLAAALPPGTAIHDIRARALDRFAALLAAEVERAGRAPVSPLIHQALVAAVEGVSIHILQGEGRVDPGLIEQARAALVRVIAATLAEDDDPVPPLPRPGGRA
jgi:AcrR family transcriptional regulator